MLVVLFWICPIIHGVSFRTSVNLDFMGYFPTLEARVSVNSMRIYAIVCVHVHITFTERIDKSTLIILDYNWGEGRGDKGDEFCYILAPSNL